MENRERLWVIKDIVCVVLIFTMMTSLFACMVKTAGGIPEMFAIAKRGGAITAMYINIAGFFFVTAITIIVPLRTYNKLKVGRTALLAFAKISRWSQLEFIETIRKDGKFYVVVGENVPPLVFTNPQISGTYTKPLEKRFLFLRNDKNILVKDKVYDDRYYLFVV